MRPVVVFGGAVEKFALVKEGGVFVLSGWRVEEDDLYGGGVQIVFDSSKSSMEEASDDKSIPLHALRDFASLKDVLSFSQGVVAFLHICAELP